MTGTTAVFSANVGSIGWTVNGRMRISQMIVYLMLLYLSLQRSDPIPVTGSLRPWPPRRLGTPAAQRTGRAADLPQELCSDCKSIAYLKFPLILAVRIDLWGWIRPNRLTIGSRP